MNSRKYSMLISCLSIVLFNACQTNRQENLSEKSKQEILQTEKDFAAEVKKNGMVVGFTKYAAPDAVLNMERLIKGRDSITQYYKNKGVDGNQLEWTAEFVDAAASGDLGYTYGPYVYRIKDSIGKFREYRGIFHSVWKKQPDGSWKFVWD